jgi:hypothetical protein
MKHWVVGGLLAAAAGSGVYLVTMKKEAPAPAAPPEDPAVAVAAPAPLAPAVLPEVVEVTDIDPLLDPPAPVDEPAPAAGPILTALDPSPEPAPAHDPGSAPPVIPPALDIPYDLSEPIRHPREGSYGPVVKDWVYGFGYDRK